MLLAHSVPGFTQQCLFDLMAIKQNWVFVSAVKNILYDHRLYDHTDFILE